MEARFLHASTVIESLRDNGYNNTAYALAELIDNSIQAQATRVEIGFIERRQTSTKRYNVEKITLWDNGTGMAPNELRLAMQFGGSMHRFDPNGMGKFGMGLPNASISQCRRVEVWSWKDGGTPHFTYLDIDEMKSGDLEIVPEPIPRPIPEIFRHSILHQLPRSGTLIVWSKLDRMNWKTGNSNFKHCEYLVGRMYREYLANGKVKIDSITYRYSDRNRIDVHERSPFKANDPMYLLKDTSLPELPGEYRNESFFELVDEESLDIKLENEEGKLVEGVVTIRASIVKKNVAKYILESQSGNKKLGQTDWGKHCAKNIGVSVMRAGRELVLRDSFLSSELRQFKGRFIGLEVKFPPTLDSIFGVTNNKQDAVKFVPYEIGELSSQAGFDSEAEYLSDLEENQDPLQHTLQIVQRVKKVLKVAEEKLKEIPVERKSYSQDNDNTSSSAIAAATKGAILREERGEKARDVTKPERLELAEMLCVDGGLSREEAEKKATSVLTNGDLFMIETAPRDSDAFFDVSTRRGITLVIFNSNHVFYRKFISNLPENQLAVMQTVIAGFARVMNETTQDNRLQYLNTIRRDWGKVITDFLLDDESEIEHL